MDWLSPLKAFLGDQPVLAFLALSLATNAVLFRLLLREKAEHLETVKQLAPLADKLAGIISRAAGAERERLLRLSKQFPR